MSRSGPPDIPAWIVALIPREHREEWIGDLLEEWSRSGRPGRSGTLRLWGRALKSIVDARISGRGMGTVEGHGRGVMGRWVQDIRLALRMVRREPIASGAALCTLAIGVWAFVLGFTLLNGVLLRPLGYAQDDRLALFGYGEGARYGVSMPDHLDLVMGSEVFEDGAAWQGWGLLFRPDDGPWSTVSGASTTHRYFRMLGAKAQFGRVFGPQDDAPGHDPVAVLSHDAWMSLFGGRSDIVGQPIDHEGVAYTIVGVLEPGFTDPIPRLLGWAAPSVWRASPPHFESAREEPGQVSFWSLATLRPGVSPDEATRVVQNRAIELRGGAPRDEDLRVRSYEVLLAQGSRASLILLLAIGIGVLLTAAANLVNLLLARGAGRLPEMGVRSALGATRSRLLRQLVVEGATLGLVAGVVGMGLVALTLGPLLDLSAAMLPSVVNVTLDGIVATTAVAVAVMAGSMAALPAALRVTKSSQLEFQRTGRRKGAGTNRVQSGMVIAQSAMAVVLVAASGLLVRSFWAIGSEPVGFDAREVAATWVGLHSEMFPSDEEQAATLLRLQDRLGATPGIVAAATITDAPMSGRVNSTTVRRLDLADDSPRKGLQTLVRAVTPGYFRVMGVSQVGGRALLPSDQPGAIEVAVVNRTYADRHFSGEDPLGRAVLVRGVERQIVGVVEDVTEFSLGEPRDPALYLTYAQERETWARQGTYVVMRTNGDTPPLAVLRDAARDVDPRIPIGSPFPLQQLVDDDQAPHRFRAFVATALAAIAVVLATVGLAGVTAYAAGRRARELGIRVALGAKPNQIARTVLSGSGRLTLTGIAVGVLAAIPLGNLLSAFLYRVRPTDPVAIGAAAVVLGASALVASAGPTRRALRVDPVDALRRD